MIHAYGAPDPPVARLLAALASRGHVVSSAGSPGAGRATLVLAAGGAPDPLALGVLLGAWAKAPGARVLVVSALGAHPDARAPRLARLWRLEEDARGSGLPVLTLRLAPIVGPDAPLWLRLRARPRLPRGGRALVQPVAESDVVETLERALADRAPWAGWYEVAGPDVLSLAELAALATAAGPAPRGERGAWEPALAEIAEHRLAESGPWATHFGLTPARITDAARAWAA